MNYRHHFHAGNFADVMKHALWLTLLTKLTHDQSPIRVTDTHAGAGLYDLQDALARRSKEAEAGVGRLMSDQDAPGVFAPLQAAIRAENPDGLIRYYPGSPLLSLSKLGRTDIYVGCELRADDKSTLQTLLNGRKSKATPQFQAILGDGYIRIGEQRAGGFRPVLLIDPPFERGDDYAQIISGVDRALQNRADAVFAIWAPLKDLETFDALLRGLEALRPRYLQVAETRLRPLIDPLKMNGSAMIFIGAPTIQSEARTVCDWIVTKCGEDGGRALVRELRR